MVCRWKRVLMALAVAAVLGGARPALAQIPAVTIELSASGAIAYDDLRRQAEAVARDRVNQYFQQHPDRATVEIVVLGERNGNLVPILTATVERAEWRPQAPVQEWARLFAAHTFLEPRRGAGQSPAVPQGAASTTQLPPDTIASLDRAFDTGSLSPAMAQRYLSYLD